MEFDDNEEEISQLKEQLRLHRFTLAHYRSQQAQLSSAFTPPGVMHGIAEARQNISRIKQSLRQLGAIVEDHQDDKEQDDRVKTDNLLNKTNKSILHNDDNDILENLLFNIPDNNHQKGDEGDGKSKNKRLFSFLSVKRLFFKPLSEEEQWQRARNTSLVKLKKLDDPDEYKSLKTRIHKGSGRS